MSTTINKEVIQKFSKLADEWWDVNGKFKPLHMFNPIRIEYINIWIKFLGIVLIKFFFIFCEDILKLRCLYTGINFLDNLFKIISKYVLSWWIGVMFGISFLTFYILYIASISGIVDIF